MGDDDRAEQQLPHRARGPAEATSARAASPSLSAETWQRMQAAVESERARATGHDQRPAGPAQGAIAPAAASRGGSPPAASQNQLFPSIAPVPLITPEPAAYPLPAAVAPVTGRPPTRETGSRRGGVFTGVIATALILIAAGSLGVTVARYITGWEAGVGSVTPALTPEQEVAEHEAAAWVSHQVSHTDIVSCDPVMCQALTADGFPSRVVRVLGPTSSPPVTSAVVIVTQVVREQFGNSFTSLYAPGILASYGSPDAIVTVQVIDAQGAGSYQKELAADQAQRRNFAGAMVGLPDITVSAKAKQQLLDGQPDFRLMLALASLATKQPIDILDFGNIGPGADDTIPLRYADLAESDQAAHPTGSAYVRDLRTDLDSTNSAEYHPASITTVTLPSGQALRVEFAAPTPLTQSGF